MFLNMNNITCEDLVEFFKITFKLQNISIPMDTRMLLCSYFESLHLAKLRNKSESISEFVSICFYVYFFKLYLAIVDLLLCCKICWSNTVYTDI